MRHIESRVRVGDPERELYSEWVSLAYSKGYLDLAEMHDRTDKVAKSKYGRDLAIAVRELPTLAELRPKPAPKQSPREGEMVRVSPETWKPSVFYPVALLIGALAAGVFMIVFGVILTNNDNRAAAHAHQVQLQQQEINEQHAREYTRQVYLNWLAAQQQRR